MANDGALIETELGVKIKSIKQRVVRSLRMKLIGIGHTPNLVNSTTTHAITTIPCRGRSSNSLDKPAISISKWVDITWSYNDRVTSSSTSTSSSSSSGSSSGTFHVPM